MTVDPASTLSALAALVCKRGVSLGKLGEADRERVLALAATAVPIGAGFSEAQVNEALRHCLREETVFLDTDHVELRRWLVDAGFWRRDGFGRRYERVRADELTAAQRSIALALEAIDVPRWVAAEQSALEAQRLTRRAAWQARQEPNHG